MHGQARRNLSCLVLYLLGLLAGLGVLGYAIYSWAKYGFTMGPIFRDAPDPSAPARFLVLAGLTLTAYAAFGLWILRGRSKCVERRARDDASGSTETTGG